jgi:hypothetical protein
MLEHQTLIVIITFKVCHHVLVFFYLSFVKALKEDMTFNKSNKEEPPQTKQKKELIIKTPLPPPLKKI